MVARDSEVRFFTVATNIYFDYWVEMVRSFFDHAGSSHRVIFVVFTDKSKGEFLEATKDIVDKQRLVHRPVSNMKWPEATLSRYRLMAEAIVDGEHYKAYHIDADMRFHPAIASTGISELKEMDGVALVQHPGFSRPKERLKFYRRFPKMLVTDAALMITAGGLGTWESNSASRAFVKRALRSTYVAGGFWGGDAAAVRQLSKKLDTLTELDRRIGIVPRWHDESYLNKWSSGNEFRLLPPSYCWTDTAEWLAKTEPVIEAITKARRTR